MNAITNISQALAQPINPLAFPQFPLFSIDTRSDVETDQHIVTFSIVTEDGLALGLTTDLTLEVNDTASVQASSHTPYDGWCDIDYSFPQLTKFSLCRVVWVQDVNMPEGALISLTEQQMHTLNEMISQAAYETATA